MKEKKTDTSLSKEIHHSSAVTQHECGENATRESSSQSAGYSCRNVELSTEEKNVNESQNSLKGNDGNLEQAEQSQSQSQGCTETDDGAKGETKAISLFYLSPCLRNTFAAVGASDQAYTFRQILSLLKAYLYSKRHLFDRNDILYVNCGNDPLGQALGVKRFHFNDVKLLIAMNIMPVRSDPQVPVSAQEETWVRPLPVPVKESSTREGLQGLDSRSGISVGQDSIARTDTGLGLNNSNDKDNNTASSTPNCFPSSSKTSELGNTVGISQNSKTSQDVHGNLPTSPVPGPSHQTAEEMSSYRTSQSSSKFPYKFVTPFVPDSGTDSDSVYSCQGYETVLCHNTEYEESDETFSEEDERDLKHSDDDDSIIEDVGVAVLAFHALCDSERDFWPDSDTEDESTDEDPELVAERWHCLSCGQKNKAFVRYCSKCWQLRKHWLPERPKKRKRRKPRPKKRHKKCKTEASTPEEQFSTSSKGSENIRKESRSSESHPPFRDNDQNQSTTHPPPCSSLSLASSELSTSFSLDRCGSQDSGIFLSQGSFTNLSQEVELEDLQNKDDSTQSVSTPTKHAKGKSLTGSLGSYRDNNNLEKEKSPHSQMTSKERACGASQSFNDKSKKLKKNEEPVKPSVTSKNGDMEEAKIQAKGFLEFLSSKAGKEWLNSENGKQFQSSQVVQETLRKATQTNTSHSYLVTKLPNSSNWDSRRLCLLCHVRPKNASIIHGRRSHQATCYQCALHLFDSGAQCPVCQRKIHMVCKHIVV